MKKPNCLRIFMILALCSLQISSYAQALRSVIQGENGKTAAFTRLTPEQQVMFTPAQAAAILGLDAQANLVLMNSEPDALGETHYRYYQTYDGIPVENTMYLMHVKNGSLTSMNGVLVLDFNEQLQYQRSVSPVTATQAIDAALHYVNAKIYAWQSADKEQEIKQSTGNPAATFYPSATLAWYAPGDVVNPRDLRLTYKVDVYALEPLSRAYYFVDAQTGQVVGKKDELFYSDAIGTANTVYSGTQTIHSDLNGASYRLRDYTKGNGVITLKGTSSHPDYTSSSSNWTLSGADQYALDAHYGVSQTWAFYKTVFNRNSVNNAGFALTSYVNEASTVNNAYWDGSTMHFGVRSNGAGITAIDVTGHELTHGVTQYTSGLNYSNQAGAINESMSDIFGKSVQFWSKPNDVNWLLSNDMNWGIRNMSSPNQFGQPDTYLGTYWYSGSSDNGGVHTNSGVGNFMFYLLVTGGSGVNDISNSYTVTGLGLTDADAILYRSETVYLTPTSQYADWRNACINAATDLFGASSNQVTQVKNAWYAVGVGTAGTGGCSIPSGLTAGSITTTGATLSWPSTGATSYNLQWKPTSASSFTTVTGLTTPSYSLTGLTACTNYQYQVQGVCASSTSPYSAASSFTTTGCTVTYCASHGTSTSYEYINRVVLGTINNTSGDNGGYANFTALSTNLVGGTANTIGLTPGFHSSAYPEYWNVWIDYNHNGVFTDPGEKVAIGNSSGALNLAFTVPTTVLNGATRMRIQMQYGTYPSSSCLTYTYGEVEDYTVNITGNAHFDEETFGGGTVDNDGITLYPNPVRDNLTVAITSNISGSGVISVHDLLGRKVLNREVTLTEGMNTIELNTAAWNAGIYILEMNNNGKSWFRKFVVAR